MDYYFLDDYTNSSRLKSKRKKKQLVKKDFEKQLIQLSKLEKELWEKRKNLPLIPLETPYQKRMAALLYFERRCSKIKRCVIL